MMNFAVIAALVACALTTSGAEHHLHDTDVFNCIPGNNIPSTRCFTTQCTDAIADQINRELNAAFTYLYMATHFDDNRIARPGMANFLYESASEERHHAIMMIDYLNNRGVFFDRNFDFAATDASQTILKEISKDPSLATALTIALNLEIEVTNHIYNVVKACEADFHGADFFTEPILAEQHDGVRKLQGAIRAFRDLRAGEAASPQSDTLAEFIFDKKMLAEGLLCRADCIIDRRVYEFPDVAARLKQGARPPGPWQFLRATHSLPDPRAIKTHMPFSLLPPDLLDTSYRGAITQIAMTP